MFVLNESSTNLTTSSLHSTLLDVVNPLLDSKDLLAIITRLWT